MFKRWKREGKDVKKLWRDMKDAAVKSFLSAEATIQHYVQNSIRYRYGEKKCLPDRQFLFSTFCENHQFFFLGGN
jgi:hypothetical protein